MKQSYNTPMLQVVSIKRNDIITGSEVNATLGANVTEVGGILGADRFRDDYDAGY